MLFHNVLEPYGDIKEGQERCLACFENRLNKCYQFAHENHYDYFGTVMTISRYKNAQQINQIGERLSQKYQPTKWLFADFKKNNGYEDSLLIIREQKMYLQEYCGCFYSYSKKLGKLK
jgi:predicted adenine nucleotide alpha hydrolase (AANH) superfamily ATPase